MFQNWGLVRNKPEMVDRLGVIAMQRLPNLCTQLVEEENSLVYDRVDIALMCLEFRQRKLSLAIMQRRPNTKSYSHFRVALQDELNNTEQKFDLQNALPAAIVDLQLIAWTQKSKRSCSLPKVPTIFQMS